MTANRGPNQLSIYKIRLGGISVINDEGKIEAVLVIWSWFDVLRMQIFATQFGPNQNISFEIPPACDLFYLWGAFSKARQTSLCCV